MGVPRWGWRVQAYLAHEWAVIWPPTFTLWPRRNNYEQTSRRVRVMSALPPISHLSSPFNENDPRRRALNPSAAPKEDVMFKALPVAVFVTVMSLSPVYLGGKCISGLKQWMG